MGEKMNIQAVARDENDKISKKFVSGDTIALDVRKTEWEELKICGEEAKFDPTLPPELSPLAIYDKELLKKSEDVFRELHKLQVIETYKYVATYLLDYFGICLLPQVKRAFVSFLKDADLKQIAPMDAQKAGEFRRFMDIGAWEKKEELWTEAEFKALTMINIRYLRMSVHGNPILTI